MLTFNQFIAEEETTHGNESNTALGDAFETATALHIHNNTAAKNNPDPQYQAKIQKIKEKHLSAMAKLSPEKAQKASKGGEQAGSAYLTSLKTNHGMAPEDIHEVHHTNQGIDAHIGHKLDRVDNPHDIIVKGKKAGKDWMHGTSLKLTSGTASNNSAGAFDKKNNIGVKVSSIWSAAKKQVGLDGASKKAIKLRQKEPEVIKANAEAGKAAAAEHANAFNNAPHEAKQEHLRQLLKAHKPDLDYDYTVAGSKPTSQPIMQKKHIKALNAAKKITATVRGNVTHFHDEHGNHIAMAEHRTTHGPHVSPQVNAKFGTMSN